MAEVNKSQREKEETDDNNYICTSAQRTEYFNKLEKWLIEAYAWHSFVGAFPYLIASSEILQGATPIIASNIGPTLANANINTSNEQGNVERPNQQRANEPIQTAQFEAPGVIGVTYKIPPMWKRYVAEIIDSMMLVLLKIFTTYIAVEVFDIMKIQQYYMNILLPNLGLHYKLAMEITSGLIILELIHRIFVCVFEASWLQHGRNGRIGGATPGKSIMRLKVVQCRNVTPVGRLDDQVVLVVPGTDLGLLPALGRSVIKNIILAFIFPIIFAIYSFRFNRTVYDLICNSIVVEDVQRNGNNNINNNNNNNNNLNNNNNINIGNQRLHQQ